MASNSPLIPDAAVQAIQDSVETKLIAVDDHDFTTRPVFIPPPEPLPKPLMLNTLEGLSAYIKSDLDAHKEGEPIALHVVSHEQVDVVSSIVGRHGQRMNFATLLLEPLFGVHSFTFGKFYELEEFSIKLRTLFVATAEQDELLRLLGNIKEERVRTTEDDGVSQTVIARVGIASVAEVRVPSPIGLRPFRTFRELEQPASPFIIRLRAGDDEELPTAALFECDGGGWKLEAIESIKIYLDVRDLEVPIFA